MCVTLSQQQKYKWANRSKYDEYAQQNERSYARDSWGQNWIAWAGISEEGWMTSSQQDDPVAVALAHRQC